MKRKLKIWGISNQDTGVQLYRINQPLRYIAKQDLAKVHLLPFFGQHANHLTSTKEFGEYYEKEAKWADVLFTTLATDKMYLSLLLAIRTLYKIKLVVDIDDDILATHTEPNNPAYKTYLLKDSKHAECAAACIREADLVIASTEYIKRKYENLNPNIIVIKNTIDKEFFSHDNAEDGPIIGYAGSGSHQADWMMVEKVLAKLSKTHDFKVRMLGPMYASIPLDKQIKWVGMLEYPETLSNMGFTIGLAPLRDSMMNRAKSNLRWLEYSSLGIPTVASDVLPFQGIENIIRVSEPEEWEAAIADLLEHPDKGTHLGKAAKLEVEENYDPYFWSRELYNGIFSLFERGGSSRNR